MTGFFDLTSPIDKLKKILFDEFNGFSDKRIKHLSSGSIFIIDDRNDGDFGANKTLYSYFCSIFAEVISENQINMRLSGNVPKSPKVKQWIKKYDTTYKEDIFNSLTFEISPNNFHIIGELAGYFRQIVKPGARYNTPNYKYVCPRTADSLEKLKKALDKIWN